MEHKHNLMKHNGHGTAGQGNSLHDATEAFGSGSIPKTVVKNCIPALIAMLMVMVYNLADTFFIGLTHDDMQVAAVSLGTPIFMIFMSLGTLFGVGGTAAISRALGAGNKEYAAKISSFCMWACIAVGLFITVILWGFLDKIIVMLGASANTMDFTRSYIAITSGGGIFTMIAVCFSNIIRADGQPMKAMIGTVVGNLLNIVLDPIMILWLGWGVTGAAVATVIGNLVGAVYYIVYFLKGDTSLSIGIRKFSMKQGIFKAVVSIGISASLTNLLVSLSTILVNGQLAKYGDLGDLYVAGYGVTSKVLLVVVMVGIGIGAGTQPIFGYCYGAKNKERLKGSIRFSTIFGTACCLAGAALCFIFAGPIVKIFLTHAEAYDSAIHFTRILMTTAWVIAAFAVFQGALQAMGAALASLLPSVFRQCIIFIPAMYILNSILGVDGLLWAQPVADVLSLIMIYLLMVRKIRKSDFSKSAENESADNEE